MYAFWFRSRGMCALIAVALVSLPGAVEAQTVPVPQDYTQPQNGNVRVPRSTPDPMPIPTTLQAALNRNILVPGDVLFDPLDNALSLEQKDQITRAHRLAWQQVKAALLYLQANERRILAGVDPFYNSTFGRFYDRAADNPLAGQYEIDVPAAIAESRSLGLADVSGDTVTFMDDIPYRDNIHIGDRIVIDNQVHTVLDLMIDTTNVMQNQGGQGQNQNMVGTFKALDTSSLNQQGQGGGGGGGGGGQTQNPFQNLPIPLLQEITLTRDFEDLGGTINTTMIDVHRVVGLTSVTDREHYERVLLTFEMIRDLMLLDTTYTGDWDQTQMAFNTVFAIVDPTTAQPRQGMGVNGGMLPPASTFDFGGELWDRSLRQFGYSNSDSLLSEAQRVADPSMPLRWTEDNARILEVDGSPTDDEDLLFFNQHMTIFGEFDQGGTQGPQGQPGVPGENFVYVGGGFLSENQNFVGPKFDSEVSEESRRTDLLQYQQIIAAFAEFAPDFLTTDTAGDPVRPVGAGFGILDVVLEVTGSRDGNGQLPFPQNMDAEVFAQFANVLSDPELLNGIGDGSSLPPAGKTGVARGPNSTTIFPFTPLIPLQ